MDGTPTEEMLPDEDSTLLSRSLLRWAAWIESVSELMPRRRWRGAPLFIDQALIDLTNQRLGVSQGQDADG